MSIPEIIALVLSGLSIAVSVFNYCILKKTLKANHERQRKQLTIEAFDSLKQQTKDIENHIFIKYGNDCIPVPDIKTQEGKEELIALKQYLNAFERFSVGVNM